MSVDQTVIRSEKAFTLFIKTHHKDRYQGRLPLFPITIKDLRRFINHKSKTCQFKAIQWLMCGLAKHPKHDKKWKETVLGHRKVQSLLERYRTRDNQRFKRQFERRVPTDPVAHRLTADPVKSHEKGFKTYNTCVTSTKLYNTGSIVTSYDRAAPKKKVTFAPVIEEVFPIKEMDTIELDIQRLATKVHINTHVVPVYRKQPIPLRHVAIPVGQTP